MRAISDISTIEINGVIHYLPKTETDVKILIKDAIATQKTLFVRGSGHSFPLNHEQEKKHKFTYILMSYFNRVNINMKEMRVTVGGGCHLGYDPFDPVTDPSCRSTLKNSLFYKLFRKGLAIPEMGGITHQTVAGFLSTGSAGGSLKYSFGGMLESITMITAENSPRRITFPDDTTIDEFNAAAVAMGLFGIIIEATFKCIPTFNIKGMETISKVNKCKIDLFGSGTNCLKNFLIKTHYSRLIWWPQSSVKKMVVWEAMLIEAVPGFKRNPYKPLPEIFGTNIPASAAAYLIYSAIGKWPKWFLDLFNHSTRSKIAAEFLSKQFYPVILPAILDIFVPVNTAAKPPQEFQDHWYCGLCMDNEINDKLMPVEFAELWIPMDKTQEVMNELQSFYGENEKNFQNTGSFCCEIYGAKNSDFWMSPSYKCDMIRIDVFWFANSDYEPVALFQRYWDRFEKYNFRCHWGKYLPEKVGALTGPEYLQKQYPKWNEWMALRKKYDPQDIFVTPYWKTYLGI